MLGVLLANKTQSSHRITACEPVCVCVSLVRAVIICPASTHTAIRVGVQSEPGCSSPSYIHTALCRPRPVVSVNFALRVAVFYMSELPHITNRENSGDGCKQEMLGLRIGRVRNVVEGLQECFTYLSSSLLGQGAEIILLEYVS